MVISGKKNAELKGFSAEHKGCVTWFILFLDLLYVRYNCVMFYHCRICVVDFKEMALFAPCPSMTSPQNAYPEYLILMVMSKCPFFSNTVLNVLNNYIPHETNICDERDPTWITSKVKEFICQKNNLYFLIKKRRTTFL